MKYWEIFAFTHCFLLKPNTKFSTLGTYFCSFRLIYVNKESFSLFKIFLRTSVIVQWNRFCNWHFRVRYHHRFILSLWPILNQKSSHMSQTLLMQNRQKSCSRHLLQNVINHLSLHRYDQQFHFGVLWHFP